MPDDGNRTQVIDTTSYREVVGVVHNRAALERLEADLTGSGVDRGDIDLVSAPHAEDGTTGEAEAMDFLRHEVILDDDRQNADVLAYGTLISAGVLLGAMIAFVSGGSGGAIAVVALVGAVVGTVAAKLFRDHIVGRADRQIDDDLANGGLAVLVHAWDAGGEKQITDTMRKGAAERIHVHDVELNKTVRGIPLGWVIPDPWLSNRRLAG